MSTPRTSLIAGPARITFRGQTLFSSGDVLVSTRVRAFTVAAAGQPPQRREDAVDIALTFTPSGAWSPMCALLGTLSTLDIGRDLFRAAGGPVVIDSTDGWTYTYANAALTTPPPVVFSAGRTLFGPATFTAHPAPRTAPTAPRRRLAIAPSAYPAEADGYDPAVIVASPYTLSWGSDAPWINLTVADGISLAFDLALDPWRVDGAGTVGLRLAGLSATARACPLGVPDTAVLDALKIQGPSAGRGRALGGRHAPDLVVRGAGVYARLHFAALDAGGSQFGATPNRVGELGWTASIAAPSAAAPLRSPFFLGTTAPL